jgi:hypothetical protein
MVRKWSTGPISLSYTTPLPHLYSTGRGGAKVRVADIARYEAQGRVHAPRSSRRRRRSSSSEAAEEVFDLSERGEFQPPCWNPL